MEDGKILVNIGNIPSNSKNVKKNEQSRPPVKKIATKSEVVNKKGGILKSIATRFIKEDLGDMREWFIDEVIIPGIQDTFFDALEMLFYGRSSHRGRGNGYYNKSYSSYYRGSSYSDDRRRDSMRREKDDRAAVNVKISYDDIILENKGAAQEVVNEMRSRIREYDYATIADLYQMVELPSDYNDHDWGWFDENAIGIKHVREGFLIDVDKPVHID